MKPRLVLAIAAFLFIPVDQTVVKGERLNLTDQHVTLSAISDGALGTAHSDVHIERRPVYVSGREGLHRSGGTENSAVGVKGGPGQDVMETQHTTCQVTTEQLVATAQATVTRVLEGLCTSRDIDSRFSNLEESLLQQLKLLTNEINDLSARMDNISESLKNNNFQLEKVVSNGEDESSKSPSKLNVLSYSPIEETKTNSADSELFNDETDVEDLGPREREIQKYNSSINIEVNNKKAQKVFTYYWRIPQMRYKLTEMQPTRSIRSPNFYIYSGGYRLFMRSFPRHDGSKFFIHVGVTKGDFDKTLKWPFLHKFRIHILDQTPNESYIEDIASKEWDPSIVCKEGSWSQPKNGDNYECVCLGIPHDLLSNRKYIYANNLVVKLTIYLDS